MTEPKFYNKDGSLTKYHFLCGGGETRYLEDGSRVEMYHSQGYFHVVHYTENSEQIFWDNFDNNELTKTRKRFKGVK